MSFRFPWSNCADLGGWPLLGNGCLSGCAAVTLAAPFVLIVWLVWRWVW